MGCGLKPARSEGADGAAEVAAYPKSHGTAEVAPFQIWHLKSPGRRGAVITHPRKVREGWGTPWLESWGAQNLGC